VHFESGAFSERNYGACACSKGNRRKEGRGDGGRLERRGRRAGGGCGGEVDEDVL